MQPLLRTPTGITAASRRPCSCTWEAIPTKHLGAPEYYVVHAWQAGFHDLVQQLCDKAAPPAQHGQPPHPLVDLAGIYVWLDFVAIPSNLILLGSSNSSSNSSSGGNGCDLMSCVKAAIDGCAAGGVLVVVDRELLLLRRCWCLMEIFLAVYHLEASSALHVLFPGTVS